MITDIARGEADLDTLKAGASLIPMAKITKVPKVVKAIGNVGKTGSKKGKQGEKIAKSGQAKQTKTKNKEGSKLELTSSIDKDPRLVKAAKEMGKNERIQQEANHLIDELSKGNENPGLGTKNLFKDVSYLRGRNNTRVFYRRTATGYEILGKADKANEKTVINIINKIYK